MPWPPREWLLPPDEEGTSSSGPAPYPWPPPEFLPQEQPAEISFTPEEVAAYEQQAPAEITFTPEEVADYQKATPAWQPAGIIGAPIPDVTPDAGPPPLAMPAPTLPGGYDIGLPLSEWAPPAPAAPAEPPQEVTFTPEEVAAYEQAPAAPPAPGMQLELGKPEADVADLFAPPKMEPGPVVPTTPEDYLEQGIAGKEAAIRSQADLEAERLYQVGKAGEEAEASYQQGILTARQWFDEEKKKTDAQNVIYRAELDAQSSDSIDPRRRFKNADTFEKILWIASAAIGGFLAPYQNGKNTALEMMQKEIQDDINAQLADMDNRRFVTGQKMTMLQQDRAEGRDIYESAMKASLAIFNASAARIEAMGKRLSSPLARANADELVAGLRMHVYDTLKAEEQRKFTNALNTRKEAEVVRHANVTESQDWARIATERDRLKWQKEQAALKAKVEAGQLPREQLINNIGGSGNSVVAPSKEDAKLVKARQEGTEKMLGSLYEIRGLLTTYHVKPDWWNTPKDKARIRSLVNSIVTDFAISNGQGAMGERERQFITDGTVGDWNRWIREGNALETVDESIRTASRNFNATMRVYVPGYQEEFFFNNDKPAQAAWVPKNQLPNVLTGAGDPNAPVRPISDKEKQAEISERTARDVLSGYIGDRAYDKTIPYETLLKAAGLAKGSPGASDMQANPHWFSGIGITPDNRDEFAERWRSAYQEALRSEGTRATRFDPDAPQGSGGGSMLDSIQSRRSAWQATHPKGEGKED